MHRGGEDCCGCGGTEIGGVWDKWGRQPDHWQTLWPHICTQINLEGCTQEWRRTGQAERQVAHRGPTLTHR